VIMQLAVRGLGKWRRRPVIWGVVCLLVTTTLTFALWMTARRRVVGSLTTESQVIAEQLGERIRDCVKTRIEMISQIRREWALGGMVDDAAFSLRAASLIETFPGYQAVNEIDETGRISLVYPPDANRPALGRRITDTPAAGAAYQQALVDGGPRVTAPLELFQGGTGIAAYVPTSTAGRPRVVLNGVFRTGTLIPACLGTATVPSYTLSLRDGNALVFERRNMADVAAYAASTALPLFNRTWNLRIAPGAERVDAAMRPTFLILVAGLPLCAATSVAVFMLLAIRRRARERALAMEAQRAEERQRVEAKLQQVQRMEALGQLAGSVAHDFNNLLSVITASTYLLRERKDEQALKDIEHAANRAAALTRELVTFGRGAPRAVGAIDLAALVGSARGMLSRLCGKAITLEMNLPSSPVMVRGSAAQLEQVLMNLVVNAIAAMPSGGRIVVEVTATATLARLSVADTGVGIDPRIIDRIFEPYFTTKPPGEGTGLGLATVYGNVRSLDGEIGVESKPGQGTRFTATFPLTD
jgi:two-component system, cell cycle sensor histidine kinase and response regulator CckA